MGQRETLTHDILGRISSITDFNGQTTRYEYDAYEHLKRKYFVQTGKSVDLKFSPLGKIEQTIDENGTTLYNYNLQERLTSQFNPDGKNISYTYDHSGQLIAVTTSGNTVSYSYDELARLSKVVSIDGTTNYVYDDLGNLRTTKLSNGIVESRTYDVLNRLTSVVNSDGNGSIISQYDYILDVLGNKTKVIELNSRQVEYKYDELMRLTNEKIIDPINGNRTIGYSYDSVGNRISKNDSVSGLSVYSYDSNDRLTTKSSQGTNTIYTYDNNTKIASPTQNIQYGWNPENRLISVDTRNSLGVQNTKYKYDFNGNRIATVENGQETRYLVDTNRYYAQVLEEYQADGQTQASYAYGLDLISKRQGSPVFYLKDGFSGIRQLTNAGGQVTDAYIYDVYGRLLSSIGNTDNNYGYQGQQSDNNSGLQYLRARYYDPNLGRFTSTDPREGSLDSPISRHRYLYANDNPMTFFDPSGEFAGLLGSSLISSILDSIATATIGFNVLNIALGTAATITAAAGAYAYWANRGGGVSWSGKFNIFKTPAYGSPIKIPTIAYGYAELTSGSDQAKVSAIGASYTLYDLVSVKLPSRSSYNVELIGPDVAQAMQTPGATSKGSFLGPFIFSTLRFTWPYILPENTWVSVDETDGVLGLGLTVGLVSKAKNIKDIEPYDRLRYDPFEVGIVVGVSSPTG